MPDESNADDNGTMDMAKMLKMMEMAQFMQSAMSEKKQDIAAEGFVKGESAAGAAVYQYDDGYYDACIQNHQLRSIKAAIPHLDYQHRKNLSIFVKMLEIQKLNEFYGREIECTGVQANRNWKRDMIKAVYPHVPPKKQQSLELLAKMLEMQEMMEKMKEMNL